MFLARIEEIRDPHLDVIFVGQRVFPGGGRGHFGDMSVPIFVCVHNN